MEINSKKIGDFPIHPIGIGTWLIGGKVAEDGSIVSDFTNDDKSITAIRYSLRVGQNHIDTGQIFGAGHTDELISKAIKGFKRSNIFISSKVWKTHIKRDKVKKAVDLILKRLDTDYLDMLSIHKPWPEVPFEETIQGINDAIDSKTVRYIGVNNLSLEQLKKAVTVSKYPIRAIQVHYSLWNRESVSEDMHDYCVKHGIAIVAFKPLERGKVLEKATTAVLKRLSEKYHRPVSNLALNWIIKRENLLTIPKSLNLVHIKSNVDAANFVLSDEDWKTLTEEK